MSRADSRLERLFGDGATAFGAAFDLVPDPVGVLWAIREPGGAIADFETGYSNPTMARMIGVATEASIGRRLLKRHRSFVKTRRSRACATCSRAAGQRSSRSQWSRGKWADRASAGVFLDRWAARPNGVDPSMCVGRTAVLRFATREAP